jgi:hypothetical protein
MNRRRVLGLAGLALLAPGGALASGGSEKKKGGGSSFIQLPTTTATIVRPNGRRGVMTVETGVDAADPKVRDLAQASLPRLRAAYAQTLRTYAAGLPANRVPDADFLARTLQRDTDRVIGRSGAKLLLGAIMIN